MKKVKLLSIFAFGALLAFSSCKKDETEPTEEQAAQTESFKVRMTDNPGNYSELDVEITKVEVYRDNSEWITLNGNTQVVSVLDLTNGEEVDLAFKQDVAFGAYSKVRLTFGTNNELKFNSFAQAGGIASSVNLAWNGSTSQTVEVEINEQVDASTGANILLDFNVQESIIDAGTQYLIDPTVTLISDVSTGVQGEVQNDTRAAIVLTNDANATIKFDGYTNDDGEFLIRGMVDGTYTMTVSPDQDEDGSLNDSYTVNNVVIVQGEITQTGTIVLQ